MVIGIDLRPLNTGGRSGVEEYTTQLLKSLFLIDHQNQYKLFFNSFTPPRLNFGKIKRFPNVQLINYSIPNKVFNCLLLLLHQPKIDQMLKGVDLFFSPNIIFNALSAHCPHVITFHDLSFERHPDFFSAKMRLWHKLISPRKQAQRATKIIAVSESTRHDLLDLYGLSPAKIEVIYSGILSRFQPRKSSHPALQKIRKKFHLPELFFLYLGTIEPRKNVEGLILAFEEFKKRKESPYKLVIAGKPGWLYQDVYRLASHSPYKRDIIFTGFIPSEDKPYLYNLADLFVYPSFYEGFGFPPLEAMASGIPVITSHISSLPEVVENHALMVDPYNVNEIAQAFWFLTHDAKLREELTLTGGQHVQKFQWQKTAQETLRVFRRALKTSLTF